MSRSSSSRAFAELALLLVEQPPRLSGREREASEKPEEGESLLVPGNRRPCHPRHAADLAGERPFVAQGRFDSSRQRGPRIARVVVQRLDDAVGDQAPTLETRRRQRCAEAGIRAPQSPRIGDAIGKPGRDRLPRTICDAREQINDPRKLE